MNPEMEILANRLLSALLNGVYQGALLTILVWLGLKFFPRTNAATRYAVGLVTLLLVAALPVVHFFLPRASLIHFFRTDPKVLAEKTKSVSNPGEFITSPNWTTEHPDFADIFEPQNWAQRKPESAWEDMLETHGIGGEPPADFTLDETSKPAWPEQPFPEPDPPMADIYPAEERTMGLPSVEEEIFAFDGNVPEFADLHRPDLSTDVAELPDEESRSKVPSSHWRWRPRIPRAGGLLLIGLWVTIASLRLAALARQYLMLYWIKRRSGPAPARLQALFASLRQRMAVRREARMLAGPHLTTPMVVGFCRPAVLLPTALIDATGDADWDRILRHELAHLHRRDDWTNLLQQLIRAALFFHPSVWWLSRRLTLDREIACDDYVLTAMKAPKTYALFLTDFAGRTRSRDWAAAPAAWSNKSQLNERINMILDQKRNSSPRLAIVRTGTFTLTAIMIAILAFQSAPRLAFGQIETADSGLRIKSSDDVSDAELVSADADVEVSRDENVDVSKDSAASSLVWSQNQNGSAAGIVRGENASEAAVTLVAPKGRLRSSLVVIASPRPAPQVAASFESAPFADSLAPARNVGTAPALPGAPPAVAIAANAPPEPAPPAAPVFPAGTLATSRSKDRESREDSIERRLERLEKLVESLVARDSKSPSLDRLDQVPLSKDKKIAIQTLDALNDAKVKAKTDREFQDVFKTHPDLFHSEFDQNAFKTHPELFHWEFDQDAWKRNYEQAVRQAERASHQARQAAIQAQKMAEQQRARSMEMFKRNHPLELQRQLLNQQREELRKRVKEIESQLETLDDQLDDLDQQFDEQEKRRDETGDERGSEDLMFEDSQNESNR